MLYENAGCVCCSIPVSSAWWYGQGVSSHLYILVVSVYHLCSEIMFLVSPDLTSLSIDCFYPFLCRLVLMVRKLKCYGHWCLDYFVTNRPSWRNWICLWCSCAGAAVVDIWLQDWSIFPICGNPVYRFQSSPSTFPTFILVYRHANHARQETPVLLCVLLKITAGRQLSRGFFSLILEFRSELGSLSFWTGKIISWDFW